MPDHVYVHLPLLQGPMLVYQLNQLARGLPDDRPLLAGDRHAVARSGERALGSL